jgi:serine/alanine adding enzyme
MMAPPQQYGDDIARPHRPALAIVEPDDAAWDSFTEQHPQGHLLQSSGWGRLKAGFGWQPRRIAVAAPEGVLAGAQVLFRRRLGVSVAYVPRGPLFAGDAEANTLLLAALDRLARRNRAVFLRLEPNLLEHDSAAGQLHSLLLLQGFQVAAPIQPRSSIHLDLTPAPERLLAAMNKGHRADIRRAERDGVAVWAGAGAADLATFYAIYQETAQRAGFAIHSQAYYQAAWDHFTQSPHDTHAQLLLAGQAGKALAAFLIFEWAGEGLYLYSCSTEAGQKSGANHLLQWRALLWAKERGCARYDFWGIPDELGQAAGAVDEAERARLEQEAQADPMFGVFRFKKSFGGQVVRYLPAYDRIYLPPLYALWRRRLGS